MNEFACSKVKKIIYRKNWVYGCWHLKAFEQNNVEEKKLFFANATIFLLSLKPDNQPHAK